MDKKPIRIKPFSQAVQPSKANNSNNQPPKKSEVSLFGEEHTKPEAAANNYGDHPPRQAFSNRTKHRHRPKPEPVEQGNTVLQIKKPFGLIGLKIPIPNNNGSQNGIGGM